MAMIQHFQVNTIYFTSNVACGGPGGGQFYLGLEKGEPPSGNVVVSSLRAWYNSETLRGIEVGFTDGNKTLCGHAEGTETETLYLGGDRRITEVLMWSDDHDGGRMGRFEIHTNDGRIYICDAPSVGDPYKPDVGSGILVGVFGAAGDDVDSFGFALRRKESEILALKQQQE